MKNLHQNKKHAMLFIAACVTSLETEFKQNKLVRVYHRLVRHTAVDECRLYLIRRKIKKIVDYLQRNSELEIYRSRYRI